MIQERDDIVALDSAIIQHPRTWEASGHLAGFSDPLVQCLGKCKRRFRAGPPAGGGRGTRRGSRDRQVPGVRRRADRAARVQPDVPDDDRPGAGGGLDRLPAPGDGAGHLPGLQDDATSSRARSRRSGSRRSASRSATRSRPATSSSARSSSSRWRWSSSSRPTRRGSGTSTGARSAWTGTRGSASARAPAPAPAHRRRALALLEPDERRRVPVPDRLVGARGRRQPRRLRPHPARRSTRARSSSGRTRRPARATSRT